MNFNSDDPLAELLSDNSLDNDSFFDNPTGTANKTSRTPASASKSRSNIDDLFGIKEEKETADDFKLSTVRRQSPYRKATNVPINSTITSMPRITTQHPSQSNDDEDDDLGFDPKKPKVSAARGNFFDDLLGTAELKRPATAAPVSGRREDTIKPSISRQSTDTTTDNSTNLLQTQSRPRTSTGRRSSGISAVANTDPLGLFGATAKDKEHNLSFSSAMPSPKSKIRSTTADWLGLGANAEDSTVKREDRPESPKRNEGQTKANAPTKDNVEILEISHADEGVPVLKMEQANQHYDVKTLGTPIQHNSSTAHNIMLLNSINMESVNAYSALQQQGSQLTMVAQMKQQEQALQEMQRKQGALLLQQERQFQTLLQQQIHRQAQLEEHINKQQQRINTHIELMMAQPALMMTALPEINMSAAEDGTLRNRAERAKTAEDSFDRLQLEANVKRLELEKLRLEGLVSSLRANCDREVEMIEESYKKQLKVSEEHFAVIESRLKSELEQQTQYYSQKFETLETDKQKMRTDYEMELSSLRQDSEDEVRKLRKSHEEDLDMLKDEHRRMLENVRQSKLLEFAAVQENGSYLHTLREASSNLELLSGGLNGLREDMKTKIETLNKETERKLEARERRVEDAERRLKITEETAEEEKRRLMELVSTLECQLNQLSKDSAEENWQLRQKLAALEADKQAFEKEKEFSREQMSRDEKRIAELKEKQLAETQKAMLELQEDRARLLVERTMIETERKLHPAIDYEKERLEVEAAVKVAQDATRQADAERERYYKVQRQVEQQKRGLVDKENMLRAKEEELEQELNVFRMAERQSQEAQQRARLAEQNFQAKIQILQQRMREVGEKEATVTQERMLVTQERISLQNLKAKVSEHKCTLCKMNERREEITQLLNANGNGQTDPGVAAAGVTKNRYAHTLSQTNMVDRMLDENIEESYRKMKSSPIAIMADYWTECGLDDDSKELALHNIDNDLNAVGADYLHREADNK